MPSRYQELSKSVRRQDHRLAKDWPKRSEGSYEDFLDFSRYIDPRTFLQNEKMVIVSRWPNAVIDQYFLDYQFFPKPQWPRNF